MILLNLLIIIDIACTFAVIWFVLFILLMYLYGEGLVSCKNLFPVQLYIYIDNKIIIRWISIGNIIIYLEAKFRSNRWIFVFGDHFVPWLPWQRPPFWIFSIPQKLPHTTVDIPTKFHEVWWQESQIFLNLLFFVSMATAAKFVHPIPIFLAYLVRLDVDVVPITFHQFLFGE